MNGEGRLGRERGKKMGKGKGKGKENGEKERKGEGEGEGKGKGEAEGEGNKKWGRGKREENGEREIQHMPGDAPHHALSHIAPLHLLYTQHMAGDASRDVIDHATIGLGLGTFLLVVHWNHASILHRYGNIAFEI